MTDVAQVKTVLDIFTGILIKNGDFTVAGVEKAFREFSSKVTVHKYKPPKASNGPRSYIRTTLAEAVENAKLPVLIPVRRNQYGNWESTIYPGLLFNDPEPTKAVAFGMQDGPKIAPLSINQLLICQANGFRYMKNNTVGSAKHTSSELEVK